ncbi:spore germination protein [Peribacillus frigoritolerans]|nr:spore germination protein [Peribacillus frigoritolerans]
MTVGSLSKTKVAVLSIEGIVDQENVDNVIQRINDVEFDEILDRVLSRANAIR